MFNDFGRIEVLQPGVPTSGIAEVVPEVASFLVVMEQRERIQGLGYGFGSVCGPIVL